MKRVCKTQMMPPPDHQHPVDMHTSIMCINILQNIKAVALKLQEELAGKTMFPLCSQYEKNDQVQLPVILRIFEENQNLVDMHTSIMYINILQNIKAVAPKLQEEIAEQTMYLYPDRRTDGRKDGRTVTLLYPFATSLARGKQRNEGNFNSLRRPVTDNICLSL